MLESVDDINTCEYENEIIVEVMGEDEHGDFGVVSYQLAYEAESAVAPKCEIDGNHEDHVETAVTDAGYSIRST
jgi:hypothetical protein